VPITGASRPALWKLARLDFDPVRERPVLLYPEGVILLSETAGEILQLCDGRRTVADIAATLGTRYHTDVTSDVIEYLGQLADRELVRDVA
jgi:pyrroloquinoline quinone biosynthesis protein D